LLDGLDEEKDSSEVLKQVCKLSEEYYKNQLIITCRIASQHYQLEGFTDIEIVDFDEAQIEASTKVVCRRWQKSQRERVSQSSSVHAEAAVVGESANS